MNSQTIEQLVFECGLQTPTVIVPAVALLLLFAWMLIRERKTVGLPWVVGFWVLRAVALTVLVWMFLQPARVTETKTILPQSVAVVVDTSESMQVIDPADEGQGVRWHLANLPDEATDSHLALASLDCAIVALDVAKTRWSMAQDQFKAGADVEEVKENFEAAAYALNRSATRLDEQFCSQWDDENDQSRARDFASQCSELAESVAEIDATGSDSVLTKREMHKSEIAFQALVDLNRLVKTWSRTVGDSVSESLTTTLVSNEAADRQTQVTQLVRETENDNSVGLKQQHLSIRRFTFDDELSPVLSNEEWQDSADQEQEFDSLDEGQSSAATNLTAAIEQISRQANIESIRAAVFLTDGAHNAASAESPAVFVSKLNHIPISFVPIGSLKQPRDAQLYHVAHPRSVIRGDKIVIEAFLSVAGFEGQEVNLQLLADDELIEQKALRIETDQIDLRHTFTVPTERKGSIEFELKVESLDGESSTTNNRAIFRVGVVQDKIRVMLADRISRWEFRYLDQLFFRDEHLEHEMILFDPRLRATGKLKEDAALPVTAETWNEYDVAVIGDLTPDEFPVESQETLVEWVKEKGGIAILIAGRSGMPHAFEEQPVASLLPVEKSQEIVDAEKYRASVNRQAATLEAIRLNDAQSKSEQLWKQVYEDQPITWLSDYSTPRPSARRLMDAIPVGEDGEVKLEEGSLPPAWVCWHQLGSGRVVYLSAPDTYRLRYRRGDYLHHRFWAQMLRWITSSDPGSDNGRVKLSTDKVRYTQQEPVEVSAFLSDALGEPVEGAQVQASFQGGDEDVEALSYVMTADDTQPGHYFAKVEGLQAGAWRVSLQGDVDEMLGEDEKVETFVNVITSPNVEQVNTTCNRPLMKQIAQASGGYVIPPTALSEWLALQTGMPETISQIEREPLWNRWSSLWIAFGCLATEWFVRRAKGLT